MAPSKRLSRLAAFTALAVIVLSAAGEARATGNLETNTANTILNRIWHANSFPLPWRFSNSTAPPCGYASASAPAAQLQPAILAAFNTHQNLVDSALSFTFAGNSDPNVQRNIGLDGVNLVTFCDAAVLAADLGFLARTPSTASTLPFSVVAGGGCPAGQGSTPDLNGGAPGGVICFPVGTYPAGTIVDADVEFNTFSNRENLDFTTTAGPGFSDIQAISTHEIGHFYGLSHDPIPQAVMYPFIDDEPASDTSSQRVLKPTDVSTAGRYYPEATYGANFGTITGTITIDGQPATGVHVIAIDPTTMLGVVGRLSLTEFQDPATIGPEGPDFAANGEGFYRIDGLPPGSYQVYVEYLDQSEFFTGRLENRYNTTVLNSNVAAGSGDPLDQAPVWLGFLPALAEYFNTGDSGNGGDGVTPGTAVDNADVASLVTVTAGNVTSGIDIAINIEPDNTQNPEERENPTARSRLRNDLLAGTDVITAFLLNGASGGDDWWAIRFPAANLPTPPYNVAEGQWVRGGRRTLPYTSRLMFTHPTVMTIPNFTDPIVPSAGRSLTGGPGGNTAAGDFLDVRDQWNVTINEPRDVWVAVRQPPPPAGIMFITQGFFAIVTCVPDAVGDCISGRVNNTLASQNNGATWGLVPFDVFYDLLLEEAPPVMINAANPPALDETDTANVDISGFGFVNGATVSFSGGVLVNTVTFMNSQLLRVNVTVPNLGLTGPRGINVTVTNPGAVFPNVARVFTANRFVDSDGDGLRDSQDCAPGDASLKLPAGALAGLDVADLGATTQISWTSQDGLSGTATNYDLVTGIVNHLRASGTYLLAVCGVDNDNDTPFTDVNAPPAPGTARYWLGRAHNNCNLPNPVTFGNSSIVPDPRDALDGGAVCTQ